MANSEPDPFEVLLGAVTALAERGEGAWERAASYAGQKLDLPADVALRGAVECAAFARVKTHGADPRRFAISPDGEPALLMAWPRPAESWDAEDLVAIALERERFWRLTLKAHSWWLGEEPRGGVLRLRTDARAWARQYLRHIAALGFAEAHPAPAPGGILVLAPDAIDWTRHGWLRAIDAVEILDAPADGKLGRILKRQNPTLGTARGVELRGTPA